jgi:hypothetical protein
MFCFLFLVHYTFSWHGIVGAVSSLVVQGYSHHY